MSLVPHILYFGKKSIVAERKHLVIHDGQVARVGDASHQVRIGEFESIHRPVQLRIQTGDVLMAGLTVEAHYGLGVTCYHIFLVLKGTHVARHGSNLAVRIVRTRLLTVTKRVVLVMFGKLLHAVVCILALALTVCSARAALLLNLAHHTILNYFLVHLGDGYVFETAGTARH